MIGDSTSLKPGILTIILLYFLFFIIAVIPFYNWLFRWGLLIVNTLVVLAFPLILFLALQSSMPKLSRIKSILILLSLICYIFASWRFAPSLRISITQAVIDAYHCDMSDPITGDVILGGLLEMNADGLKARSGAFEDTSACLAVPCVEQFYYCSNKKWIF
jgi:hypothetical protein